jgi:hypothetical protein
MEAIETLEKKKKKKKKKNESIYAFSLLIEVVQKSYKLWST